MARSHGDDDLIAAIYDAIIEPSGWNEVVKRIVEATKSFSGNLVLQQVDAGSFTQTDRFRALAYYDEFVRPQGWVDLVATGLMRAPNAFSLLGPYKIARCGLGATGGMAPLGNPRATFAARCGDPEPPFPYESNNRLARRSGRGGRFRRLSLDRGLPGRLRQPQSRGHRAASNGLAV
jgi:hypothetical protein